MQDSELIQLMKKKPDKGMKQLTEQYSGLIYAVVKSKLCSGKFAVYMIEDCIADTFSDFYINLDKYDEKKCSIKTWLCVIAKNKAIDMVRKSKTEMVSLEDIAEESEQSDSQTLESDFEDKAVRLELLKKIKELGEPDCSIMIRKYYLNQTSKEIAEALGLSAGNVDTRACRAVRKLKDFFGGDAK